VASTVGLISMHIIGVNDDDAALFERSRQPAIDLGIALQLTNILRDVGEDLARGRVYLPQEDLRRFGYTEADLKAGVIDDRFRALMRFEIQRAREYYARSIPAIAALKPDGRVAVGAAAVLYRGILDKIIENGFDVFNKRAFLSFREKLRQLPWIVWMVKRLRLPQQ
jgi:phytoene synthase